MPSWIKKLQKTLKGSSGSSKSLKLRPRSATWSVGTDSSASSKASSVEDDKSASPLTQIQHVNPTRYNQIDEQISTKLKPWHNAVVVVIGASAGIGTSICISLVRHGFTVVACSRTSEVVNVISEECTERKFKGKLYAYKSELSQENDIKGLFSWVLKKFGRIDILINNPELVNDYAVKRLPPETLRQLLQKRILTLVTATKIAGRYMSKQKGSKGHIFNICSTFDLITTEYEQIMSSSSPETKRASARGLKIGYLDASKVQLTAISPGKAEADFFRRVYGDEYMKETTLFNEFNFSSLEVANTLLNTLANS